MVGISNDRLNHCLSVARFMKQLAESYSLPKEKCEEMFMLGYLHDIGYEYAEQAKDHPYVGAEMLRKQGYKYWQEILYHGQCDIEYSSQALTFLNTADLCVNSKGENVGALSRLADIGSRYGKESEQYITAVKLAKKIGLLSDD